MTEYDAATHYERLAILAGLNVKGYNNFFLATEYSQYVCRVHLNHENDTVLLKSQGDTLHEVIEEMYFKYLKITGKLPEFDPNKAIEYTPETDDTEVPF